MLRLECLFFKTQQCNFCPLYRLNKKNVSFGRLRSSNLEILVLKLKWKQAALGLTFNSTGLVGGHRLAVSSRRSIVVHPNSTLYQPNSTLYQPHYTDKQ